MSGGGGTSGKVEFPEHMEAIHKDWLAYSSSPTAVDTDLIQVMNNALGASGNPFETLSYTDPDADFTEVETEFSTWKTAVSNLDEEADYSSIIDQALNKNDTIICRAVTEAVNQVDDKAVMRAIKAYEARSSFTRTQAVRRFAGQMSDINAVQSSSFLMGMALIESQHIQDVDDFHAKLTNQLIIKYATNYMRMVMQSAQLMTSMLNQKVQFRQALASVLAEIKKLRTVAEAEFTGNKADLNAEFARWDFRVFEYASAVLGSMGGGTRMPEKPSKLKSALSGAMGGASAGAALGPWGAVGGAVLGGTAGALE